MNLGCAKAWNQGVRASRGEVVGILNNDIVVTMGWLSALLSFMDRTGCGIVSPAMREGPLDYELDRYAAEFTAACRTATRRGLRGRQGLRIHVRCAGDPHYRRGRIADQSAGDQMTRLQLG